MIIMSLYLLLLVLACHCEANPQVTSPLGKIQGYIKTSYQGRQYSSFEGIPYAKPPVGDKRFEESEAIGPWIEVWDARFPTTCPQSLYMFEHYFNASSKKDEDCLHINVYVPRVSPNSSEKLEVIVHIHGGAYHFGSGHHYAKPGLIMDHDVIFVTFNYRLGVFGFLSTEDDVVPGNNGLKDQVMALQWIQNNIASFGGNPESVTLTGYSTGGSATHLHYFSEMSRGLFHRGFSQSGVALNPFTLSKQPLNKAKVLAKSLGCPSSPTRSLVKCLKLKSYEEILNQTGQFFEYNLLPLSPFGPVVEKGVKPFLSEDPYILLKQGKVYDVPWITSNTLCEGMIIIAFFMDDLDNINKNWEELAPILLDYKYSVPASNWKSVAKKVKDHYLGQNQEINMGNLSKLLQLFNDGMFLVGAETAVREQSRVTKSPVYYYYFNYTEDINQTEGIRHGHDARYYFSGVQLTPHELKMKDVLLGFLISYAKTGKPTIAGVKWNPTKYNQLTYLDVNSYKVDEIKQKTVTELTPRTFWSSLGFQ